jgi:hypothetical protein
MVQKASGYSKQGMARFILNAFEAAWLPRAEKDAYIESLKAYAVAQGVDLR